MTGRCAAVFRPGRIGGLVLPNRIVMGSMHLGIETADDGGAALAAFYTERARSAGLMVTGGWAVNREGMGGPDYGLLNDETGLLALGAVTSAVHVAGGKIAVQLFHAGRYAPPDPSGRLPVAPSAVPSRFAGCTPQPLSEADIWRTINDFANAAGNARSAGFDALEIMGSEGYLLNQFHSPVTNRRTDDWGGDNECRMRFGIEVVRAVRLAVGAGFPIIFRLSGADLVPGSSSRADLLEYATRLVEVGADALNVAVGWHESRVPTVQSLVPHGVWVRYATEVKAEVGDVPVIASNRINQVAMADDILRHGGVDFVSMARPFLADPDLVSKARTGRPELTNICVGCNQSCIDRSLRGRRVSCMVNPRAAHEIEFGVQPQAPEERRRFAVVGGGPGGCAAARALASSGHRVDLFDAGPELGGQFRLARRVPGKQDYGRTITYYAAELARLGVHIRLNSPIDEGNAELLRGYDGVVVATGTRPRSLPVPRLGHPTVVDYPAAFESGTRGDRVVVIGGGGVAIDLAHLLTHQPDPGNEQDRFLVEHGLLPGSPPEPSPARVTLLERGPRFANRLGPTTRWAMLDTIRRAGVRLLTGVRCAHIETAGVLTVDDSGQRRLIPADRVVFAVGVEPEDTVQRLLTRLGIEHRVVGGARDGGGLDAAAAIESGLRVARQLADVERRVATTPVRAR
jgi:2,4-dienoyl-CoA reductase (NADPH2)